MLPKKSLVTLILFFFLLIVLKQTALGQTKLDTKLDSCDKINDSKDFYLLSTTSGELNSEIQQLETDIKDIQGDLALAITEDQLKKYKTELDNLQSKSPREPSDEARIQELIPRVRSAVTTTDLNNKIADAKGKIESKKNLVRCIQHRFSSIFSPEQSFKLTMSIAFAVLIGLVIAGFFWLSNKDQAMRRAIFAGQTGIQFLTLFSIVIAIILFGITGILQDKELAALLGGISGYILGRSSTASQKGDAPEQSFLERLVSISISPASLLLTAAAPSSPLTITANDKSGKVLKDDGNVFKPVWTSSDTAVAKVDQSGLVARVAPGTCNITASFNNISSNACAVTCS